MAGEAASERLAIETRGPLDGHVAVPGSKSITNRALLLAALADGESRLSGGLDSDDTVVMRAALEALGIGLDASTADADWIIRGRGGRFEVPEQAEDLILDCGNSGTTVRFLTAALTLASGPVVVDGNARMRERPISDLVTALRALGAELTMQGIADCPPIRLQGGGLPGGPALIDGSRSSQYVSAIAQIAPYASRDIELDFKDGVIVSRPYIDLTLEVMRAFGADAQWRDDDQLWIKAGQTYQARQYTIEPDASSAAYPFCAAAIAGGRVSVSGIASDSLQADFKILDLLERMGCGVNRIGDTVSVTGPNETLHSLGVVEMNDFPDAVLAYAVVALFADGPTTITNVANLRIKETDRLAALETELSKLGARVEAGPDSLRIEPGPMRGAEIETYDDHRMAMSLALAGLRVPGIVILDPGCVSKTWPDYFDAFAGL
ncbi:MAG: 3-phosphoshikimate 1-carboxyvinyltransferase [Myxococcales bacterium]|nr:3-phosphoshikimate 1-carboxyvinyltransferase [Myxococcales bacterium]HIK86287.1 3-phosphoshikimate 1-carboxyvinyltransferase [Myxococcales bacterium]